jgi:hypothetical protein
MKKLLMYLLFSTEDLKRYFMPLASGRRSKRNTHDETTNVMGNQYEEQVEGVIRNSSKPSNHETENDVAHQEQEQEVEGGTGNSMATNKEQVKYFVEAVMEENGVILQAGGITDFST